ncbi:MAG TPA: DUF1361 domain-containing protein [Candidatus Limnocylindria bacterium]|nr:DUF1361 domain-containing protein [Candidatus Limnocylindria bacterium]
MWQRILKHELRLPLLTLACASALGCVLVAARILLSGRAQQLYLVWNLFLAWVPLLLALRVEALHESNTIRGWRFWITAAAWLLFFPNAPYIFTDLSHLTLATKSRWWTDLVVILLFAVIGLVLAFISLHRLHAVVSRRHGGPAGWAFVFGAAFLSGFGVYLGRFERWNSWDVVTNPLGLLADSLNWMDRHSAKFTVLFGLFLLTAYALLYSLTRLTPAGPTVSKKG